MQRIRQSTLTGARHALRVQRRRLLPSPSSSLSPLSSTTLASRTPSALWRSFSSSPVDDDADDAVPSADVVATTDAKKDGVKKTRAKKNAAAAAAAKDTTDTTADADDDAAVDTDAAAVDAADTQQHNVYNTLELTPREVVAELDKYIVGQKDAKRAIALAVRSRWRRHRLPADLKDEVTPKNILMVRLCSRSRPRRGLIIYLSSLPNTQSSTSLLLPGRTAVNHSLAFATKHCSHSLFLRSYVRTAGSQSFNSPFANQTLNYSLVLSSFLHSFVRSFVRSFVTRLVRRALERQRLQPSLPN
jgi:hypothetical protein